MYLDTVDLKIKKKCTHQKRNNRLSKEMSTFCKGMKNETSELLTGIIFHWPSGKRLDKRIALQLFLSCTGDRRIKKK